MFSARFKFFFFLAFLTAVIGALKIVAPQLIPPPPLTVVSVDPPNGAVNVPLDKEIKIIFNKPAKTEEIKIELLPAVDYSLKFSPKKDSFVISHEKFFHTNTIYSLTVIDVSKNKIIYLLRFSTLVAQSDPALMQEVSEWNKTNYPLLKYIPFENDEFFITYSKPLTLKVVIKGKNTETIKAKVLNWISEKNIDPNTHFIEWSL